MKSISLMMFIVASTIFTFYSCSNSLDEEDFSTSNNLNTKVYSSKIEEAKALAVPIEDLDNIPQNIKGKRAAAVILSKYISLNDSIYSLDISVEEAKKLGVTENFYYEIVNDLEKSNEAIKEATKNGEKLILPDVKKEAEDYSNGKLSINSTVTRSGNNGKNQYGSIVTNGNEEGTDAFIPTIDKTYVLFTCRTNAAPIPVYTCKTYIFGGWNSKIKAGTLFTNTEIQVPLAASGSSLAASLYFQTTDSNGGSCNWVAK